MTSKSLFQPATQVQGGLKVLLWGTYGTGKTCAALSFPGPIAVIDLEGGTALYEGFDVLRTKDVRKLEEAIKQLEANPGGYRTIVIDPLTVLWQLLQDAGQNLVDKWGKGSATDSLDTGRTLSKREWGLIKRRYASILTRLNNLPMNVVLIARQGDRYEEGPNDQLKKVGVQPDAERNTPYVADLVLRLETVQDDQGSDRFLAIVDKVRGPVLSAALPKGKRLLGHSADPGNGLYPRHLAKLLTGQATTGTGRRLEEDSAVVAGNAALLESDELTSQKESGGQSPVAQPPKPLEAVTAPHRGNQGPTATARQEAQEPSSDPALAAAWKEFAYIAPLAGYETERAQIEYLRGKYPNCTRKSLTAAELWTQSTLLRAGLGMAPHPASGAVDEDAA